MPASEKRLLTRLQRGLRAATFIRQSARQRRINTIHTVFIVITILASIPQNTFAQFTTTRQLTNNNIIALAGSGDTLWLATERGINYQTPVHPDSVWHGFADNELGGKLGGFEFGGGAAVAVLYKNDGISFWRFDHRTGTQGEKIFNFSRDVRGENDDLANPTGSTAYARGNFWAAFGHGGLVRYDPKDNTVHAIRPGDDAEVSPDKLNTLSVPLNGEDSAKVVTEIGVIPNSVGGDSLIWVAALSKKIWTYNFADNADKAWGEIDSIPTDSIYKAIDSTEKSGGFRPYLAKAGDNPNPEINCMLFLPSAINGDSGTLAVGTTTGLYISKSAQPLINVYGDFYHVKYVRPVKSGENYALPGILRGGADGRYDKCVFVYKLKKDGDVTIKIYDYNMSLVKTAVKKARRLSGKDGARSTDPSRDVWDGTNEAGKRVWPGVYYYKITSTGGDRLFGKIILAK